MVDGWMNERSTEWVGGWVGGWVRRDVPAAEANALPHERRAPPIHMHAIKSTEGVVPYPGGADGDDFHLLGRWVGGWVGG